MRSPTGGLVVRRDNKRFLFVCGVISILVASTAYRLATKQHPIDFSSTDWLKPAFLVFAFIFIAKTRLGEYVGIDEAGLRFAGRPGPLPWPEIEACACKNERRRKALRIFLAPGPQRRAIRFFAARAPDGSYFDIDFAVAQKPAASLETAFRACADRIAATRAPSDTMSPVREFVDDPSAQSKSPRGFVIRIAKIVRTAVICLLLALPMAAIGFALLDSIRRPLIEEPPMAVDERPQRSVLFLGNSRIVANDLPKMVRDVADSAHSPIRWDIHMRAWGAATLREHWNGGGDSAALRKRWDLVILQPQSAAFIDDDSARETANYGAKLIRAGQAGGSRVALIANWALGPNFFLGDSPKAAAAAYGARMARETRALAERSGAGVIDLEGAFAEAADAAPEVTLTPDGNHPSRAGTFLAALVIYGYLSHADIGEVEWRPSEMSEATAAKYKAIAARRVR